MQVITPEVMSRWRMTECPYDGGKVRYLL